MRTTARMLITAGTVASALLVAPAAANASPVVLSQGHVDVVDVEYEDGAIEVHVHDETVEPGVERDPADVLFKVKKQAKTTVPSNPAYSFLGAPGDPVWILPQLQNPALLWAGLGTEELEPGVFQGDSVNVKFVNVIGPDDVSLYTTSGTGVPTVLVDSGDGLPDTVALPVGSHLHLNWAFEQAGTYKIKLKVTGTLATGGHVSSDVVTYRFKVVQ
ncbi:choice-of-anchor M domain-containing protein [Dactylosporangium sp. NPDC005572]|uniref:choice-of-anchor M domain-containing protein n=1 Tax=Dactylosporangium sp. NPDC005572 TaxID=3156889 RepID=UPI0033AF668C